MKRMALSVVSFSVIIFSGCVSARSVTLKLNHDARELKEARNIIAMRDQGTDKLSMKNLSRATIEISTERVESIKSALKRIRKVYPETSDIHIEDEALSDHTVMDLYIWIKNNHFLSREALGLEENRTGVISSDVIFSVLDEFSRKFDAKVSSQTLDGFLHARIEFPYLARWSITSSLYYEFLADQLPKLLGMSKEKRAEYDFCYDFMRRYRSRDHRSNTSIGLSPCGQVSDVISLDFERLTYDAGTTDFRNECIRFRVENDGRGKITKSVRRDIIGNRKTGEMKGVFD